MRRLLFAVILAGLVPTPILAQEDACSCSRAQIVESVRGADTAFYARIRGARIESQSSETISLSLEVIDRIRGSVPQNIEITTTRADQCGINARVGSGLLFVYSSGSSIVDKCSGSGLQFNRPVSPYVDLIGLRRALTMMVFAEEMPGEIPSALSSYLRPGRTDRKRVDKLFLLIDDIDDRAEITATEYGIQYRNLSLVFLNDVLIAYIPIHED